MRELIKRRDFMKSIGGASVTLRLAETESSKAASAEPLYRDPQLPVGQRVADLLGRMTLEEKVAQIKCPAYLERALRDEQGRFLSGEGQRAYQGWLGRDTRHIGAYV